MPAIGPLVFLSHSGVDTEYAKALKARIVASPAARDTRLKVWLDVDDLRPGQAWQTQIGNALETATAFCVLVGSRGVVNWVDREVQAGVDRATGTGAIPFVPVRVSREMPFSKLPLFVRQFQGVTDPLRDEEQLGHLISSLLSTNERRAILVDEPFIGLRAMDDDHAHLFFGREAEVEDLITRVRSTSLVAIVADSGAGKSSLAKAGLIPAWRGGRAAQGDRAEGRIWHVVVMRPGSDSTGGLMDAVENAAKARSLPLTDQMALRNAIDLSDPRQLLFALRCGLPAGEATQTLLIVDQFEEALTLKSDLARDAFLDCLADLAETGDQIRIVLTVRADYVNLVRSHERFARLVLDDPDRSQLRLKSPTPEGLHDIVARPLAMAGHDDREEQAELLRQIARDTPDRAGDLALVQMALKATWRQSRAAGVDLVRAYGQVEGVLGALAHEAERAYNDMLSEAERARLLPLFARLVRLGETGGATRRIAKFDEFPPETAALARRLATAECGRLLQVDETTIEISHEALITQWGRLQNLVNLSAGDIRLLARLGEQAELWARDGGRASLGQGDLTAFTGLAKRRQDWISRQEAQFLTRARWRNRLQRGAAAAAVASIAAAAILSTVLYNRALDAERAAENRFSQALVALSEIALRDGAYRDARELALAAWPRAREDSIDPTPAALSALWRIPVWSRWGSVNSDIAFSPDGARLFTGSRDGTVRIWDPSSSTEVAHISTVRSRVRSIAVSPNGRHFAAGSNGAEIGVWDLSTGEQIAKLEGHERGINSVAFSPDGASLATGSSDRTVRIWDIGTQEEIVRIAGHRGSVFSVDFSPDGTQLATGLEDGTVRIWNPTTGAEIARFEGHESWVWSVAFSPDGTRLASGSADRTARIWDLSTNVEIALLEGHENTITSVAFAPEGGRLATGSYDGTARIWDFASWTEVARLDWNITGITSVVFSPDGARLAMGALDGFISVFLMGVEKPEDLFRLSCDRLAQSSKSMITTRYGVTLSRPVCDGSYDPPPPPWLDPASPLLISTSPPR